MYMDLILTIVKSCIDATEAQVASASDARPGLAAVPLCGRLVGTHPLAVE